MRISFELNIGCCVRICHCECIFLKMNMSEMLSIFEMFCFLFLSWFVSIINLNNFLFQSDCIRGQFTLFVRYSKLVTK